MPEREPSYSASRFKEKIRPSGNRVAFPLASVILAVAAACSNGGGESTPTPTKTPTLMPKPTPVETFKPIQTSTPLSTETSTPKPLDTSTPRPPTVVIPTNIPTPLPRPTELPLPPPTQVPPLPLEVCNTGGFINPVDGQTVSGRVDVRAQLARNNDFNKGCSTDSAPNYVSIKAVVIDNFGRRWPWVLNCGFVYPDVRQEEWQCSRDGVILSSYDHGGNDLELEIDGRVVGGISLNY